MSTLEERVARLEAIHDIEQLVARFSRGTDRHNDPEVTRQVFSRNAVWESPQYGCYEGLEAIVKATSWGGREVIRWSMHFMVSLQIELEADNRSAKANWYLWEPMIARHPDGEIANTWYAATYDSHLERVDGDGWRIRHLFMEAKLLAKVGEPWPGAVGIKQIDENEIR